MSGEPERGRRRVTWTLAALALAAVATRVPQSAPLTPGNVLVLFRNGELIEMTRGGATVQVLPRLTWPSSSRPPTERVRDLAVTEAGEIAVFNGTFAPLLSTLDPQTGRWRSVGGMTGWSTINNEAYGGIAAFGAEVHVTDMALSGDDGGVIRFDLEGAPPVRVATELQPHDVTLGWDGFLYAQGGPSTVTSGAWQLDPCTGEVLRRIQLDAGINGLAVDADGHLYGASFQDWALYHFDPDGSLLAMLEGFGSPVHDLDLAADGAIVVAARFDEIYFTDVSFSALEAVELGSTSGHHVAWTDPVIPAPGLAIGAGGVAGLAVERMGADVGVTWNVNPRALMGYRLVRVDSWSDLATFSSSASTVEVTGPDAEDTFATDVGAVQGDVEQAWYYRVLANCP